MRSYSHVGRVLTVRLLHSSMVGDTPAMPLHEAHSGGFFVSGGWLVESSHRELMANAREGVKA